MRRKEAINILIKFINKIYDMLIEGNNIAHWHDIADNAIKKLLEQIKEENEKIILKQVFKKANKSIDLIFVLYDSQYKEDEERVNKILNEFNSNSERKKDFVNSL